MPESKPAKKSAAASSQKSSGFTEEEKAAMREAARERKGGNEGEGAILAKIATMKEPDRSKAKRVHEIVKANAPGLTFRTWYGMPAYVKGEDVICFFQDAAKFKARYATLGFSDKAKLDEGNVWPVVYAMKELAPADEARIAALVKKAVS